MLFKLAGFAKSVHEMNVWMRGLRLRARARHVAPHIVIVDTGTSPEVEITRLNESATLEDLIAWHKADWEASRL